jgi:hypothetical protein
MVVRNSIGLSPLPDQGAIALLNCISMPASYTGVLPHFLAAVHEIWRKVLASNVP